MSGQTRFRRDFAESVAVSLRDEGVAGLSKRAKRAGRARTRKKTSRGPSQSSYPDHSSEARNFPRVNNKNQGCVDSGTADPSRLLRDDSRILSFLPRQRNVCGAHKEMFSYQLLALSGESWPRLLWRWLSLVV